MEKVLTCLAYLAGILLMGVVIVFLLLVLGSGLAELTS